MKSVNVFVGDEWHRYRVMNGFTYQNRMQRARRGRWIRRIPATTFPCALYAQLHWLRLTNNTRLPSALHSNSKYHSAALQYCFFSGHEFLFRLRFVFLFRVGSDAANPNFHWKPTDHSENDVHTLLNPSFVHNASPNFYHMFRTHSSWIPFALSLYLTLWFYFFFLSFAHIVKWFVSSIFKRMLIWMHHTQRYTCTHIMRIRWYEDLVRICKSVPVFVCVCLWVNVLVSIQYPKYTWLKKISVMSINLPSHFLFMSIP